MRSINRPEPNTHRMKAKRRRHDPEFKARVALEALKGIKIVQQIAKDFELHPVQVSEWKKTMTAGAGGVFSEGAANSETEDFERERAQLHANHRGRQPSGSLHSEF